MSGLALGAGSGGVSSLFGGLIGSNAAEKAASTQAQAAEQSAQLQAGLGQESLGLESQMYGNSLALDQPYLQSGTNAMASLDYLLGQGGASGQGGGGLSTGNTNLSIPGVSGSVSVPTVKGLSGTANTNLGAYGSLLAPYSGGAFQAPTAAQAQATPGYQFALQQGEQAQQAGAAANGSLLTGGTQEALNNYAQNYANTNYNNVYNQALNTYQTNYNTWANQQANTYNRLAGVAGMGQTTAQTLGGQGLQSAGQMANTLTNTGQQIGQGLNNAAEATASGYVGGANAWQGALSGAGGSLSNMLMLQQLLGGGQGQQDANQVNNLMASGGAF
jgi:hypothetical protein